MTERFIFTHESTDYEAIGNFGSFIITKFPADSDRMMRTHGTPSGADVVSLVSNVGTQDELLDKLNSTFPSLTNFKSF